MFTSGYAPRGPLDPMKGVRYSRLSIVVLKFFIGVISLGRVEIPSPKIVINLPRTYEKLPVTENHIGSEVGEILPSRQKKDYYFIYYYRICP